MTNGLTFQVAAPRALKDAKKVAAPKDCPERLRRATAWVHDHREEWAEVWSKATGLPYEVAVDSVNRTDASRVVVTVDDPLVASEREIAGAFTELGLIPRKVDFADFTDRRLNGHLPPSTTPARD